MRSRFYWNLTDHDINELNERAVDCANALVAARRSLAPATKEQILSAVGSIASMLQTTLPDEDGLKLYLYGLSHIPAEIFKEACLRVARTHKYPRLPLPADFAAAVQNEVTQANMIPLHLEHALKHTLAAVAERKAKENSNA